jgi:hypothetical protein
MYEALQSRSPQALSFGIVPELGYDNAYINTFSPWIPPKYKEQTGFTDTLSIQRGWKNGLVIIGWKYGWISEVQRVITQTSCAPTLSVTKCLATAKALCAIFDWSNLLNFQLKYWWNFSHFFIISIHLFVFG